MGTLMAHSSLAKLPALTSHIVVVAVVLSIAYSLSQLTWQLSMPEPQQLPASSGSVPDQHLEITARTPDGVIMGVRHRKYPIEGIQFHPESILTTEGPKIVKNWLKLDYKNVLT